LVRFARAAVSHIAVPTSDPSLEHNLDWAVQAWRAGLPPRLRLQRRATHAAI